MLLKLYYIIYEILADLGDIMISSKQNDIATKNKLIIVLLKNIILLIVSFSITNLTLVDKFMPFAIAILAFSFWTKGVSPLFCLLGCALSTSLFANGDIIQRLIELVDLFILLIVIGKITTLKKWSLGLIIIFVKVINIVIFKLYTDDSIYFSLLESLLSISAFYLILKGVECIENIYINKKLSNDQIYSFIILLFLTILGFGNFSYMDINFIHIISILICFIACAVLGGEFSAMLGLFLGFLNVITINENFLFLVYISFAAYISSLLIKLKNFGVIISYIIVNIILAYISDQNELFLKYGIEMLMASFIFLLLPNAFFVKTKLLFKIKDKTFDKTDLHLSRFKKMTANRLNEISQVFKNTGDLFISAAKENMNYKGNVSKIIGFLAKEVCTDCEKMEQCWEQDFLQTYNAINSMFISYEQNGEIIMNEETKAFLNKCPSSQNLYDNADALFSNYFINVQWKNKIEESKLVAGEQLCGVSRVISDISSKISDGFIFLEKVESNLYDKLCSIGYRPNEVCVENSSTGMTVMVNMKSCNGSKKCKANVEKCVSIACGKKMMLADERCMGYGKQNCITRYQQLKRFSIYTGLASVAKKGVCGDSHSFYGLENGKYMMLICDGMGSGSKARRESEAVAALLENFFHAEFDDRTILSTINKLLILKSPDEMFSTIDMCVIDLVKGKLKFTKIGAPHSYLIRNGNVIKITPGALPIGILDEFEPMVDEKNIADGDLIVMFSDGVADIEPENKDWIIETIGKSKNPQVVADRILQKTLQIEAQKDDITVVVGRICERN